MSFVNQALNIPCGAACSAGEKYSPQPLSPKHIPGRMVTAEGESIVVQHIDLMAAHPNTRNTRFAGIIQTNLDDLECRASQLFHGSTLAITLASGGSCNPDIFASPLGMLGCMDSPSRPLCTVFKMVQGGHDSVATCILGQLHTFDNARIAHCCGLTAGHWSTVGSMLVVIRPVFVACCAS